MEIKQLGYNVCDSPEAIYRHWEDWEKIANGEKPNDVLQKLFGKGNPDEYTACVDLPHNAYWEPLLKQFPDAKGTINNKNRTYIKKKNDILF
jgi:hypothetical protein